MRYEGTVYRPPSEANSLLIQATIGCPHNKCTFCPMYKTTRFRIRPIDEIKEDLQEARGYYGANTIKSIFFPDGNTIIMKTDQLVEVFEYAHEMFPRLERITVYGSARFVSKKTGKDFKRLRAAGLTRVHTGMESGDNLVLEKIKKGTTSSQIVDAGQKLKAAGIEVSEYYLVGAGGLARTAEHALNSARTLSQFSPEFIRLRTLVPIPGTPLYEQYKSGEFVLLNPHQALREVRLLIENLECQKSILLSDHVSNYWDVNGILPDHRNNMLADVDEALSMDESYFRPAHLSIL